MDDRSTPEDAAAEIAGWADRLERRADGTRFDPDRVRVFASCDSTQGFARDLGIGAIVTTGRQLAGRGSRGRSWLDDRGLGVAVSLVLDAVPADQACIASSVAVVDALDRVLQAAGIPGEPRSRVGLKFPNDLLDRATGRKFGGILVEVLDGVAVVGIGLNLGRRTWPADVPATSLEEMLEATPPERIDVIEALVTSLDAAWSLDAATLDARYVDRHALVGSEIEVETAGGSSSAGRVVGTLLGLAPRTGLRLRTVEGEISIPVGTARIVGWPIDAPPAGSA